MPLKDYLFDALSYWEPRRMIYNGVLAIWTVLLSLREWIDIFTTDSARGIIGLFVVVGLFALIANVLYCAAYLVDVPCQLFSFRERWRKLRWALFTVGLLLACLCVPTVLWWWPGNMG